MGTEIQVDDLLGSWALESVMSDLSDGMSSQPCGPNPQRMLVYERLLL